MQRPGSAQRRASTVKRTTERISPKVGRTAQRILSSTVPIVRSPINETVIALRRIPKSTKPAHNPREAHDQIRYRKRFPRVPLPHAHATESKQSLRSSSRSQPVLANGTSGGEANKHNYAPPRSELDPERSVVGVGSLRAAVRGGEIANDAVLATAIAALATADAHDLPAVAELIPVHVDRDGAAFAVGTVSHQGFGGPTIAVGA
mmetsp:Transcript_50999/g.114697  ORF Transcript_50999/g.114697 Transcript_50999/m.114697 type:complete len:205 (+) Transcript_50999:193-807(+)